MCILSSMYGEVCSPSFIYKALFFIISFVIMYNKFPAYKFVYIPIEKWYNNNIVLVYIIHTYARSLVHIIHKTQAWEINLYTKKKHNKKVHKKHTEYTKFLLNALHIFNSEIRKVENNLFWKPYIV